MSKMNLYKMEKDVMKWQKLLWMWCACMVLLTLESCVPDIEDLQENNMANSASAPGNRSYVDLGLSVKWANCNIGANYPWEYGGYYAWGETYEKDSYYVEDYFCYNEDNDNTYGYYYSTISSNISGHYSYDVAYYKWGSEWRMPTYDEMNELVTDCSWIWTSVRGKYGYIVTGPSGNSIFLPAAGDRNGEDYEIVGESGWYWCGDAAYESGEQYGVSAYCMGFYNDEIGSMYYAERCIGFSIRPVCQY